MGLDWIGLERENRPMEPSPLNLWGRTSPERAAPTTREGRARSSARANGPSGGHGGQGLPRLGTRSTWKSLEPDTSHGHTPRLGTPPFVPARATGGDGWSKPGPDGADPGWRIRRITRLGLLGQVVFDPPLGTHAWPNRRRRWARSPTSRVNTVPGPHKWVLHGPPTSPLFGAMHGHPESVVLDIKNLYFHGFPWKITILLPGPQKG